MVNENSSNSNDFMKNNLNKQEIAEIRNADVAKRTRTRFKYGFISLIKNPLKTIVATAYLGGITQLFLEREKLISRLYSGEGEVLQTLLNWTVTISIPVIGGFFFLSLIYFFGIELFWTNKAEKACISQGIYTKAGKAPIFLDRQTDKDISDYKIVKINLNGNTKLDFDTKKEGLESELDIKVMDFVLEDSSTLIMYYVEDKGKKKKNKADMNF